MDYSNAGNINNGRHQSLELLHFWKLLDSHSENEKHPVHLERSNWEGLKKFIALIHDISNIHFFHVTAQEQYRSIQGRQDRLLPQATKHLGKQPNLTQ